MLIKELLKLSEGKKKYFMVQYLTFDPARVNVNGGEVWQDVHEIKAFTDADPEVAKKAAQQAADDYTRKFKRKTRVVSA